MATAMADLVEGEEVMAAMDAPQPPLPGATSSVTTAAAPHAPAAAPAAAQLTVRQRMVAAMVGSAITSIVGTAPPFGGRRRPAPSLNHPGTACVGPPFRQ